MKIPDKIRERLKMPIGKVHIDFVEIKRLSKNHKIISVGDVCTLALLQLGIMPHLAVFDFRCKRDEISEKKKNILRQAFPEMESLRNHSGHISEEIMENAQRLLDKGGGLLIEGEEDLTALAFIKEANEKYVLVYGQPNEGVVIVRIDEKTKKRLDELLLSPAFTGEVEGDESSNG